MSGHAREDTERPDAEKAEFERIAVGLIEATDLLGETINGYKIDEAAEWLKARGFLADDEPDPETLAGLLYAVEEDAMRDTERPERELYLARREPPSMGLNVIDGAHSDEEGVATAAKLHTRIFSPKAEEGPAVMVEVFPVPDLDPPINEDAADACREMLRDTERPDEGDAL